MVNALSWDEAVAQATSAGSLYEIYEAELNGRAMKMFKSSPPSLRMLFDLARLRTDTTSLVYEDEVWTFGDLVKKVDSYASMLVNKYDIQKGDRVAIAMRNYPEWIAAFFAIESVGAIAVLLNAWWTPEELEHGIKLSGSKLVFVDSERLLRIEKLVTSSNDPLLESLKIIVVRHEGGLLESSSNVSKIEDLVEEGATMPYVEVGAEDYATMLFTSGTTGRPKGAVSTHRAVLHGLLGFGCRRAVDALRYQTESGPKEDVQSSFILVVPLFHVTGAIPVMLGCFTTGSKLVMMHKWEPERALELIERERVTTFVGVPTQAHDLLESPSFATRDTSSLKSVGGGGAPAPPELARRIERSFKNGRPQIGYGMTETNAYGPGNSDDDYLDKPSSTGRCVPIMEVRVVSQEGQVLSTGEIGEIEFFGANLISGYWEDAEATEEAFHDGWLRTGDLGYIDEDGFVFVVDRAKDMVLRGGENIYCAEVEAVLYEHPAVSEVAVFGIPDERLGEEPVAAVVLREGASVDEGELKSFASEHLAPFKIPVHVIFKKDGLPRNAAGKVLKRELKEELIKTQK